MAGLEWAPTDTAARQYSLFVASHVHSLAQSEVCWVPHRMVFLCWNLNKRPLHHLVADLVRSRAVDVVVLLECDTPGGEILAALNAATGDYFHVADSPAKMRGLRLFTRFSHRFIPPLEEARHYSFRHLKPPAQTDVLLAVVHFPSKMYWTDDSQALECSALARSIESAEQRIGHFRTVLIGDLNMNPFENGVVGAIGLNATMARGHALKELRTVQNKAYRFFFNPMWQLFGDGRAGPPGTYHYDNHQHVTFFWNMFDQVLLRPSLIGNIEGNGVEIIDAVGPVSLLTPAGVPNRSVASDHLPLLFTMRL